jgi:ABC-2 type transport system permease protein
VIATLTRDTRANVAMARTAFRSLVAYQMSFLFSLMAAAVSALAMLYLWRSVLASGARGGFTWPDMKAYLLVAFVAGSLVSAYVDYRIAGRIREGDVALDFVKPVGYHRARFAETLGFGVYELFTGVVVAAVVALVFGGIRGVQSGSLVPFLVSAVLVLPLRFGIVYISGLVVFWTRNYIGVQAGRIALVTLFSGALVPLALFPDWLHTLANFLPFAGMASTPALIYVGHLTGSDAWVAVLVQAAWVIGLWLAGTAFWGFASRKVTIHGG